MVVVKVAAGKAAVAARPPERAAPAPRVEGAAADKEARAAAALKSPARVDLAAQAAQAAQAAPAARANRVGAAVGRASQEAKRGQAGRSTLS